MFRRWSFGLALSLALHGAAIGVFVATELLRSQVGPIDVDVVGMEVAEVKDLPLGPPPSGGRAQKHAAPRARVRAPRAPEAAGTLASRESADEPRAGADEPDAPEDEETGPVVSDLKRYGPEGSRLTVLLRTDRLKAMPYAAAVDSLLMRLPDRRDLLEGTGLELYDAFDALLISTPNPRDPNVTFLAARHNLTDARLRDALDRAARAKGRAITWRTEGGRPFAERRGRGDAPGARGDDRIIVMPARGLVVVTPPAYRALLLAPAKRPSPGAGDGGAAAATAGGDSGAGAAGAGAGDPAPPAPSWASLLRRIDAEDGLLPPTGIVMVSAVELFKPKSQSTADTAMFMGMEVPRAITAIIGADPNPFLEITAEFAAEPEARNWEAQWPALRRKLMGNPYVVLSGFAPLAGRATLSRDGSSIHVRDTATVGETTRLLELVTRMLGG
jgi:hypothetical protein